MGTFEEEWMKTCFLFPGQGAQYPGMGRDLWESSPGVKQLFEFASEATGVDLRRLLFEGSEEELKSTDNTQIAVTLVNLSAGCVLKERGIEADGCAGFSLGEFSALYEAGVITGQDVFSIVKARGALMEKASRNLDSDSGRAGMAAVIGLTPEEVDHLLSKLEGVAVFPANLNSPTQVVISGTAEGLRRAEDMFGEAMRFIPLKVSGPFHSPLMREAGDGLKELLDSIPFRNPVKRVYSNVTGRAITSGEEAKKLCVRQVVSPLRWVDEESSILNDGYDRLLEVGPGTVLTGLWKSFNKKLRCRPAGKLEEVEQILKGEAAR